MTAAVPAGHAIRRAGPADAVRALTRLAYAKWVPLVGREPTPATADYERIVREDPVDLLLHDGELVALAAGRLCDRPPGAVLGRRQGAPEQAGRARESPAPRLAETPHKREDSGRR